MHLNSAMIRKRKKYTTGLVKAIISLADDVKEDIIRSNNLLNYYNLKLSSRKRF